MGLLLPLLGAARAATLATCGDAPTEGCFATVQAAVDASGNGDTIFVEGGTYAEALVLTERVLTFRGSDTNPPVLVGTSDAAAVFTVERGMLTLANLVVSAPTRALAARDADVSLSSVVLSTSGTQTEGGLVRSEGGVLWLSSVAARGGLAVRGGQIWASDATVTINDCELEGGWAAEAGGSVYLEGGTAALSQTLWTGGYAGEGAHLFARDADVELSFASFTGASSAGDGSAIRFVGGERVPVLSMTTVVLEANDPSRFALAIERGELDAPGLFLDDHPGGGLLALDSDVRMENSAFDESPFTMEGGALTMTRGTVVGPREKYVPAVDLEGVTATIEDTVFTDNNGAVSVSGWTRPSTLVARRNRFCASKDRAVVIDAYYGPVGATLSNNLFFANDTTTDGFTFDGAALSIDVGEDPAEVSVVHNHFVANAGQLGPAIYVDSAGLSWSGAESGMDLAIHDNLFVGNRATGGQLPWEEAPTPGRVVEGMDITEASHNLFWANEADADVPDGLPAQLTGDPILLDWAPGDPCPDLFADPFAVPSWYGAARDAGAYDVDADGSPPDIGMYGGAGAGAWDLHGDADQDGVIELYDCDDGRETGASVFPGAEDPAYDGLDQDCDRHSDYDADRDGHDAEEWGGDDCNDDDATIHPGAAEVTYDTIDQDCSGADLNDLDGDGWPPPRDCDDRDATTYPGAPDTEPTKDGDCDGIIDVRQPLRPGCTTVPAVPSAWGLLSLVLLLRRSKSGHGEH